MKLDDVMREIWTTYPAARLCHGRDTVSIEIVDVGGRRHVLEAETSSEASDRFMVAHALAELVLQEIRRTREADRARNEDPIAFRARAHTWLTRGGST